MYFPRLFKRYKNLSGGIVLGTTGSPEALPTIKASEQDNVLSCRGQNVAGWPVHRIAVAYQAPSGTVALKGQMWIWEDQTSAWYSVGAELDIPPAAITFFDVVVVGDVPTADSIVNPSGQISALLRVRDPGTSPDGMHTLAMAPDLTTFT